MSPYRQQPKEQLQYEFDVVVRGPFWPLVFKKMVRAESHDRAKLLAVTAVLNDGFDVLGIGGAYPGLVHGGEPPREMGR